MNAMVPVAIAANGGPPPFMLRIEDYELLDRAGAFHGQKVELIGGRLVVVNAQLQAHGVVKNRFGRRLQEVLDRIGLPHETIIEGSLALSPNDLPDPDITIATVMPTRDYMRVKQVLLVVEVADTSLRHDLGEKRDLYSRGGVPEYWVVDIEGREVHQFWSLGAGRYEQSRAVALDGPIVAATVPDLAINGAGIL